MFFVTVQQNDAINVNRRANETRTHRQQKIYYFFVPKKLLKFCVFLPEFLVYVLWRETIMAHGSNLLSSDISRRNPQDEYELIQKIGSGTYGDVYKVSARDTPEIPHPHRCCGAPRAITIGRNVVWYRKIGHTSKTIEISRFPSSETIVRHLKKPLLLFQGRLLNFKYQRTFKKKKKWQITQMMVFF